MSIKTTARSFIKGAGNFVAALAAIRTQHTSEWRDPMTGGVLEFTMDLGPLDTTDRIWQMHSYLQADGWVLQSQQTENYDIRTQGDDE